MDKDYVSILKRIVKQYQEHLTEWELEFISSVYEWHVILERNISSEQKKIILKINAKMLGRNV